MEEDTEAGGPNKQIAELAEILVEVINRLEIPPLSPWPPTDHANLVLNKVGRRVIYMRKKQFMARREAIFRASIEMLVSVIERLVPAEQHDFVLEEALAMWNGKERTFRYQG